MITIIIADNFKKGMKSQGCVGLTPFKKKTNLLKQQLDVVNKIFPKTEIFYIYGFDSKRFNNYINNNKEVDHIKYIYNDMYDSVGQSYGLSLIKDEIIKHNECLLVLGYDPIKEEYLKSFKKSKVSCSITDHNNETKIGCVLDRSNIIQHIFFDLQNPVADLYLLKQKEINILSSVLRETDVGTMFLFETINQIINNGGEFSAINIQQRIKNNV